MSKPTLLLLSQVYVPDPASVGQYLHDVATALARRGFRVLVLTANRGYDDPARRYPSRQTIDGVQVVRLPLSSFGKRNLPVRLVAQVSFLAQCVLRAVLVSSPAGILISTSPPTCSLAALVLRVLRPVPIHYWVMDVNPDQAVALGRFSPRALPVRVFEALNRRILRRARSVITLDSDMAARLERKAELGDKLVVLPLWPHQDRLDPVAHAENPFRAAHRLEGCFVFMYSGNHSPFHPLATLLEAAIEFTAEDRLRLVFVGGGLAKKEVERTIAEHPRAPLLSLPYQPLERIRYSLSAADVHVAAMGDRAVGCCHPSKVYAALALGRPILFLGPAVSALARLIDEERIGWQIDHGNAVAAAALLRRIAATDPGELAAMGERARRLAGDRLSQATGTARICRVVEDLGETESRS